MSRLTKRASLELCHEKRRKKNPGQNRLRKKNSLMQYVNSEEIIINVEVTAVEDIIIV